MNLLLDIYIFFLSIALAHLHKIPSIWQNVIVRVRYFDCNIHVYIYRVAPKNGTVDFLGLCSDQHLSFFTLLDRASFPHYNNIKIIKFGWELFILWVISYGLSFIGICH